MYFQVLLGKKFDIRRKYLFLIRKSFPYLGIYIRIEYDSADIGYSYVNYSRRKTSITVFLYHF